MKNTGKNYENLHPSYYSNIYKPNTRRSTAPYMLAILAWVVAFALFACGHNALSNKHADPAEGKLTITNLDEHNGMYVVAFGVDSGYEEIYAADDIYTYDQIVFLGNEISGNKVELNVWYKVDEKPMTEYKGSGPFYFIVCVINKYTFTKAEEKAVVDYLNKGTPKPWWLEAVGEIKEVSLVDGAGEGLFNEILLYY